MRIRSLATLTVLAVTGGISLIALPAAASPTTLTVDDAAGANCSDSGTGTADQPYCTVQAAADAAQPGQTVQITPGTYTAPVTVTHSGSADAPITFTSTGTASLTTTQGPVLTVDGAHDVVFSHLWLHGPGTVVAVNDSTDVDFTQDGVTASGTTASPAAVVLSGATSGTSITHSSLSGQASLASVTSGVSATTINGSLLSAPGGSAVQTTDAPGTVVTGNTVQDPNADAIDLAGASGNSSIEDNILTPPRTTTVTPAVGSAQISVDATAVTGTRVDYNIVNPLSGMAPYSFAGTLYTSPADLQAATGQGGHDIQADPQLNGWTPRPTSPAIDSADADAPGETTTDRVGNPRVDDPAVANTGTGVGYFDRGAYEAQDPFAVVDLVVTPSQGPYPLPVTASATMNNPWGDVASYTFDFGDGSEPVTTSSPTAQHTYTAAPQSGTPYVVKITATTTNGHTDTVIAYADVSAPGPLTPVLQVTPVSGTSAEVIADSSTSTDPWPITSRVVDFGDGSGPQDITTTHAIRHDFPQPGYYTATLTEQDSAGRTATVSYRLAVGMSPAQQRWNLLARDSAGNLWQYESYGYYGGELMSPAKIGGGWNIYNTIVSLNGQRADATGDMVARDASGVLWLYQGTGVQG
ncbi:PKD domain-containing protein, partial [Streptacidiphilus anmyonensis]|uniref:PKD domain-containing protein n=1 Tax=Streptacidiphilus anmyonensis TaxID=405782 RepID=UPI0005A92405